MAKSFMAKSFTWYCTGCDRDENIHSEVARMYLIVNNRPRDMFAQH